MDRSRTRTQSPSGRTSPYRSSPTPSDAVKFIDRMAKEAGGVLRVPCGSRRRAAAPTPTGGKPRRSRRIAGVGVERLSVPLPAKLGRKRILMELGIVGSDRSETVSEALDEYARVFSKQLSEVQIKALAALFGSTVPLELQGCS